MMAKRNRQEARGESVEGPAVGIPPQPQPAEEGGGGQGPGAEPRTPNPEPQSPTPDPPPSALVRIAVPMAAIDPSCYLSKHVEAQLNLEQATALRGMQNALDQTHTRLASGKVVQSGADAIRWLLEQVSEE